jgi:hypothetical protein
MTDTEIARHLDIAVITVKKRSQRLREKFGVRGKVGLAVWAFKNQELVVESPRPRTKGFGIYFWDSEFNSMTFVDEGDTMEEAEWLIGQRYRGRLDPEGPTASRSQTRVV